MNRKIFLSAVVSCVVAFLPAHAQLFESQHGQQGPVAFSADEAKVLTRLASFRMLPAEEWRFHSGDVAHGESPTLDDVAWATVKTKSKAGKEAVWYRRWIEVPKTLNGYDLRGASISFMFEDFANGPVTEIVYFNGRRVAMGEDLEPVEIFDDAKPGDKVLVAVKVLASVDDKTFNSVQMKVRFAEGRPNPDDLRQEFVVAAADVPSLARDRRRGETRARR